MDIRGSYQQPEGYQISQELYQVPPNSEGITYQEDTKQTSLEFLSFTSSVNVCGSVVLFIFSILIIVIYSVSIQIINLQPFTNYSNGGIFFSVVAILNSTFGIFLSFIGIISGITWPSYPIRLYSTILYTIGLVLYTIVYFIVTVGAGFTFMYTGGFVIITGMITLFLNTCILFWCFGSFSVVTGFQLYLLIKFKETLKSQ